MFDAEVHDANHSNARRRADRPSRRIRGTKEKSLLVRMGLEALIERESARRLALLGGSDSTADAAPRSRNDR